LTFKLTSDYGSFTQKSHKKAVATYTRIHPLEKKSLLDMLYKSAMLFMELILLHCSRRNRLRLCPKINQEEGILSQGSKQLLFKYFSKCG